MVDEDQEWIEFQKQYDKEAPWDSGIWLCKNCNAEIGGERGEPPHDHLFKCDGNTEDLEFIED